ncbi:MAG TPA: non-heme iron oxygenase ferredoxin subunit [Candidatus Sumerlaeota bacterium]|nr:MAG: Naphthalene 1,2-dioxygenase system ferredoxin subunit [candidate division BRC1 bacterium ADurb.BinA292]HOE96677.1 non-heme iron oxygenase ferredoxin subunit [Candidatus Sumerlaeota bacterium]HOR28065.1 non-heme iron oxygenase ferredoxin subunit [Candidatus Sumerlaeota bacterium]
MPKSVKLGPAADFPNNACHSFNIEGRRIAIYRVADQFFATDAICTHAEADLTHGTLEGYRIICPLHFAEFDIRTGEALTAPAYTDLEIYALRVDEEGWVWIDLPD